MKNTFSPEQKSRTGNLDASLIFHQHKLDLMARFMEIKSINPEMKQKKIAEALGYSSSTLERFRNDTRKQCPYESNNPKRPPKTWSDCIGFQMTTKDSMENDKPVFKKVKKQKLD